MPTIGSAEDHDLRMPLIGLATWLGVLLSSAPVLGWLLVVVGLLTGWRLVRGWRRHRAVESESDRPSASLSRLLTVAACLLAGTAGFGWALLGAETRDGSTVADLASERAVVSFRGVVVGDPRPIASSTFGEPEESVAVRLSIREVEGRGDRTSTRSGVVVIGDGTWRELELGSTISGTLRLSEAEGPAAAFGVAVGEPEVVDGPDVWWRGAAAVRAGVREAVAERPADQRVLVPALVDGDDAGLDPQLETDFQTTGLTHLTAVSGTNLTLVVGFAMIAARWCRVRGRWLMLVGALGIVGFVLLARTEPSVVRAAAMGTVGLLAMGLPRRGHALRALGVAVTLLLLVVPTLATTPGFALSVLATAGIVMLGPPIRDALQQWLPRLLSEAIAIPLAAQLACTPVIVALSGEVSLVAVLANLLAAPAVAPATVLGLLGGLVALLPGPLDLFAHVLGWGAGHCVGWISWVARTGAALPVASIPWGTGGGSLALIVLVVVAVGWLAPVVLRSRAGGLVIAGVLACAVAAPGSIGPGLGLAGQRAPDGWDLAMCDVGQGDALVLRTGAESAVLVDVGGDPVAVDDCLDDLDVDRLDLIVLTHFHADHVAGIEGALRGRTVGGIQATPLLHPRSGAEQVVRAAAEVGVPLTYAQPGPALRLGAVILQVLEPEADVADDSEDEANNASVVVLADIDGVTVLLTGDAEPPAQRRLKVAFPGLEVDVLKVPHHGSRFQDHDWLASLGAEVALVSAGADNTYGHPAPETVDGLAQGGATVARTDEHGDVWLEVDAGTIEVTRARP